MLVNDWDDPLYGILRDIPFLQMRPIYTGVMLGAVSCASGILNIFCSTLCISFGVETVFDCPASRRQMHLGRSYTWQEN